MASASCPQDDLAWENRLDLVFQPVLIVVQCRFGSTRLPGKALYPLAGLPMLVFLLRRLKAACLPGRLVLATTDRPEDEILASWGRGENVAVMRGPSEDVLSRYLLCLDEYPAEAVVRVTADNPLTHPEAIALAGRTLLSEDCEYVDAYTGYPDGAGVDGFKADLLRFLDKETSERRHREHLNAYILDNRNRFRCLQLPPPAGLARPDVRLTVDTRVDWTRIAALFTPDDPKPYALSLEDAIKRIDRLAF
ncbi:MAG: NTP transferase domain-containing protein [Thermodesulfobacteriota bacterium]